MPSHGRVAAVLVRSLALGCLSLVLASGPGAARGSTQQRRGALCAAYADQAVAQAEENSGRGCGRIGPRWSEDFQAHYEWCLVAPLEDARRESEARARALERCGGPDDLAALCRAYAEEAVAQERENQRRRCGFSGGRWSLDFDAHFGWCMATEGAATRQESEARRRMLEAECTEEPPVDTALCERYAEESVEQQAENLRRGCGFSGDGWTSILEVHLEQCLGRPPELTRRVLRQRQQALAERCVVEPEPVRVPPVEGLRVEPALRRIAEAGLEGERRDEPSGRPAGTVVRQEPEAGRLVPVGTVVTIWVAFEEPQDPPQPPPQPPGPPPEPPRPPPESPRPPEPSPQPLGLPWPWIVSGLALAGLVYLLTRRGPREGRERRQPGEALELVAVADLGTQELEAERLLEADSELRPVLDRGTQSLETEGDLLAAERRIEG